MPNLLNRITSVVRNPLFGNSSWAITSQITQSVFLSLFFVILARVYPTKDFADFIIATVLHQLFASFSTLGLSQWFVREMADAADRDAVIKRFLKIQFYSGCFFYLLNSVAAVLLYSDQQVRTLALVLGLNVVLDNLIYAIKGVNISDFQQKRTFVVFTLDALARFLLACTIFIYPFSIVTLSLGLILARLVGMTFFLRIGVSSRIKIVDVLTLKLPKNYLSDLMSNKWPFVVIGGVSFANWRISALLVSKFLDPIDVAVFEISYRMFFLCQMVVIAISSTVFPILVKNFNQGKVSALNSIYSQLNRYFLLYGLAGFTFVYSFGSFFIPFVFGGEYSIADSYTSQMFLTLLVFPSAYIQANLLVAIHREKMDMWFNIANFAINLTATIVGLLYWQSLSVVMYSIFGSTVIFHLLQSVALVRKGLLSFMEATLFYAVTIGLACLYIFLSAALPAPYLFFAFWIVIGLIFLWARQEMGFTTRDAGW